MLGLLVHPLLTGSGSCSSKVRQTPSSEEDCSYLANFPGLALDEEFANMARYTWRASAALALGGTVHREALCSSDQRVEKQRLEESVHSQRF